MSSLRFISETNLTSSVSSFSVDNIFNEDFDIYKIIVTDTQTTGSTAVDIHGRLISSGGSIDSSANYDYAFHRLLPNTNFQTDNRNANETYAEDLIYTAKDGFSSANNVIYVFNPYNPNTYTFIMQQSSVSEDGAYRGQKYMAVHTVLGRYRGINFLEVNSRPFEGSKVLVYGLRID